MTSLLQPRTTAIIVKGHAFRISNSRCVVAICTAESDAAHGRRARTCKEGFHFVDEVARHAGRCDSLSSFGPPVRIVHYHFEMVYKQATHLAVLLIDVGLGQYYTNENGQAEKWHLFRLLADRHAKLATTKPPTLTMVWGAYMGVSC